MVKKNLLKEKKNVLLWFFFFFHFFYVLIFIIVFFIPFKQEIKNNYTEKNPHSFLKIGSTQKKIK